MTDEANKAALHFQNVSSLLGLVAHQVVVETEDEHAHNNDPKKAQRNSHGTVGCKGIKHIIGRIHSEFVGRRSFSTRFHKVVENGATCIAVVGRMVQVSRSNELRYSLLNLIGEGRCVRGDDTGKPAHVRRDNSIQDFLPVNRCRGKTNDLCWFVRWKDG